MRVHLVDGTFELFRAHYSPNTPEKVVMQADGPLPVKATYGLVRNMLALLADSAEAVTHLAIAFDNPIRSFRNDLYDGYKSDEGVDAGLRRQFDIAEEAMKACGICVWSMDNWEADDALGTGAKRFGHAAGVEQVRILTPDKDLGQVVEGTRIVQVDRMRKKLIDETKVREVWGVGPESIADLLALMGDSSDGYPGLKGWGAKSAATVLARWGSIEKIPDDPAKWDVKVTGAPRLAAVLEENRELAMLFKKIAIVATDVPLKETLADLEFKGVPRKSFETLCDLLGTKDLRTRPTRWRD